jgi:hypothetical protein
MAERRDKLGRRIPEFDRSAAGKKAMQTLKEKNGADYPSRIGTHGGRKRTRGHFGKLKDEGKETELKNLSKEAADTRWEDKDSETETQTDNGTGRGRG